MNAGPNAVEVFGLTKRYGSFVALDNVSVHVAEGEFFGFLGPNGAGKTTLIRILTTLLKPSEGTARVGCCDVLTEPEALRRQIGVVPQAMTSDLDLTGYENMDLYGRFYSISREDRHARIDDLLEKVGLSSRAGDLVATYSGGMRRRLEIARVLVHRPKILFLDEPTIGLDPQSRRVVWDFLQNLRQEDAVTLFLTTHYMEEAETLCGRVAIIDSGKIIVMGSPNELKAGIPGNDIVSIGVESISDLLKERLQRLPFVYQVSVENNEMRIFVENGTHSLPALIEECRAAGVAVLSASLHQQTLEDVFIHYTGRSIRDEAAKQVSMLIGAGIPQKLGR